VICFLETSYFFVVLLTLTQTNGVLGNYLLSQWYRFNEEFAPHFIERMSWY